MFGISEAVVRERMAERARVATQSAQYREWCRLECVDRAGASRNG